MKEGGRQSDRVTEREPGTKKQKVTEWQTQSDAGKQIETDKEKTRKVKKYIFGENIQDRDRETKGKTDRQGTYKE